MPVRSHKPLRPAFRLYGVQALFFCGCGQVDAPKKNKLPRFFSVTPLARSGRLFFVPCGAMASRHTKKKYLHEAHGHLKFCGGPAWPWPCFLSALHPRGVPPRPHTRHGGAVAFARVGLRTYRLAPAFSAFACYFLRI